MVISSELNERRPPGGSSFAGHFDRAAFAACVFPEDGAPSRDGRGAFKARLQRREHRDVTLPPGAQHEASVEYAQLREPGRPSRLRAAYEEHARLGSAGGRLRASASSPAVGMTQEGWELRAGSLRLGAGGRSGGAPGEAAAPAPANAAAPHAASDAQTAASLVMNSRHYPHPSVTRGSLKLSQPRAMLLGVDPVRDTGHRCPFWEAEGHRFAAVTGLPGARPRTPTKSLRWRTREAWDDPQNHFTMKVTQSLPPGGPR